MSNHTTAHDILADIQGRLEKCKLTGDKLMARCPAHEDKTPSLSVKIGDNGECVLLKCWGGCPTDAVLDALGLTMRDLFATDDAWRSHTTFEWTDYATGETVTQTRHYTGKSKYRWPPKVKTGTLAYPACYDPDATRPIIWCEGAKAATAAASKLAADGYDVVGFVSASTIPSADTLKELTAGRSCIVWPDDDGPGEKAGQRLVAALRQVAKDVVTVDPVRLGLTGGHGHDAAEWRPGKDPKGDFEAACGTVDTEDVEHFRSIWSYTAEATPLALIPGLAWRGRVSKISAAAKLGKTSLITCGIAAWQAGREFLGEPTGPKGRVLYVSETGIETLRAWLELYGCPVGAPIDVGGAASVDTIAASARKHKPDLVVVDSITDLCAATEASGSMWNAGDVRKLLQPLRELGCAVILVHHVRKSDGAARDSGDFEAAPDMNVMFDPGMPFGGDTPAPGPRRLRYSGRWAEPNRSLAFDEAAGYSLDGSKSPGCGGGGVGGDRTPPVVPAPTLLDETVTGYLMQHPKSSGRKIKEAIGCQSRDLRPSLARLSAAGRITSEDGARNAKLWSAATSVSTGPNPMFDTLDTLDTLNENGGERNKQDRVYPPYQTLSKESPGTDDPLNPCHRVTGEQRLPLAVAKTTTPPITRGGSAESGQTYPLSIPTPPGGEPAERGSAHDAACPGGCSGSGAVDGKACDWGNYLEDRRQRRLRDVEPVVHTEGIKKWDDATSTWVDAMESDGWKTLEQFGYGRGLAYLYPGCRVTDGNQAMQHYHLEDRANAENDTH